MKLLDLKIDKTEFAKNKSEGRILNVYKTLSGKTKTNYISEPKEADPKILIVEKYRLSTYLGQYGAGRTIKTFSLLPGEKTTISVSTYKKTQTKATEASSILDSFTEETAEEFESSVQEENSSKENTDKSFNYHAEAEASASWGWGSAKVSGGVSGSTNSSREEFAKNVSSATEKNSSKASAKRDVEINTSFEKSTEEGQETAITREIKNINVGRTLNFTFRQMNQEFITLLHLVDIRIAFFNGFRGSKVEVPLSKLDDLLETYITESKREEVKNKIISELKAIKDYTDKTHDYIEEVKTGTSSYYRVKKKYIQQYSDETGNKISIPGIVVSAKKNVMRTDGVIVESLLGQATALDDYSKGLQDEKVRSQKLDNELKASQVQLEKLKLEILKTKDVKASEVYQNLYSETIEEEVEEE